MRHRMTVQNASTGYVYELILEGGDGGYTATYRTLDSDGEVVPTGPSGRLSDPDAYEAFQQVRYALEDADEGTVDQDWNFEVPLPPWMAG